MSKVVYACDEEIVVKVQHPRSGAIKPFIVTFEHDFKLGERVTMKTVRGARGTVTGFTKENMPIVRVDGSELEEGAIDPALLWPLDELEILAEALGKDDG